MALLPYTGEHIRNVERAGGGDPSRVPMGPPVIREAVARGGRCPVAAPVRRGGAPGRAGGPGGRRGGRPGGPGGVRGGRSGGRPGGA